MVASPLETHCQIKYKTALYVEGHMKYMDKGSSSKTDGQLDLIFSKSPRISCRVEASTSNSDLASSQTLLECVRLETLLSLNLPT
jgi:hypothetical protein